MKDETADPPESEPAAFRPRPAFDYDVIKAVIAKHFKVYESEQNLGSQGGGEISAFYVQADPASFPEKFEAVREDIRRIDNTLMVILQYRGGEDIILVARKPPIVGRSAGLNLFLFIATIFTTTLAGSIFYSGYEQASGLLSWGGVDLTYIHPKYLFLGFVSFSLPVMLILGIHELGHYFIAKRHHVRTSLPFFIPVPPIVPIGTFGAFISIREPIPDRKALFDIGAAGPIAGFIASIPVLIIGLLLTGIVAAPIPLDDALHAELAAPDGTTWGEGHDNAGITYTNQTLTGRTSSEYREDFGVNSSSPHLAPGNWTMRIIATVLHNPTKVTLKLTYHATNASAPTAPFKADGPDNYTAEQKDIELKVARTTSLYQFTVPANATNVTAQLSWKKPPSPVMELGTSLLFTGFSYVIPTPSNVLIHPTGFAGWVGLLVTGFNLLPAGQLDGGHVARAVLGDRMKYASYLSVAVMFALSYYFAGWLVMGILILLLGVRHPPPLNDKTPLDVRRKILAAIVWIILIISFIPIPFSS